MTRTDDKLNVLILAAGLGTRLRPLTSEIPKPLVRVYDKSILEIQMERAKSLGDVRLHANAHYLADQIVSEGERLGFEKVWVETPEILGTAGPLRRIYAAGYRGGLLIMNGDAYCNFDLGAFVRNARAAYEAGKADGSNRCEAALLAVDFPKVNTFRVGADGCLAGVAGRFGSEEGRAATFSGISWYSDEALARIRDGEFDIREFWIRRLRLAVRRLSICLSCMRLGLTWVRPKVSWLLWKRVCRNLGMIRTRPLSNPVLLCLPM